MRLIALRTFFSSDKNCAYVVEWVRNVRRRRFLMVKLKKQRRRIAVHLFLHSLQESFVRRKYTDLQ